MIPISCKCNLDLANESWPTALPTVPRVGDQIESKTKHGRAIETPEERDLFDLLGLDWVKPKERI
jgi:hypothetical protein